MIRFFLILCGVFSLLILPTSGFAAPDAKITVKVIDDHGMPVSGTEVTFGFTKGKAPGKGWGTVGIGVKGKTDQEGHVTVQHETGPYVTIQARKKGYYHSGERFEPKSRSPLLNRWEPWNPTIEVVLKKKRNPVGMYVKYLEAEPIPDLEAPAGYDLEKGDWVAPYGTGIVNDLIFICQNKYQDFMNAETSCDITFSNPHDGLRKFNFSDDDQSYFKWPFEAPDSGYDIKKLNKWMSVHMPDKGYESNYQENTNYLLRVRSEVDKDGNIIKANYGKIKGDIRVYKKAEVNFTYYFNPDTTRNLEEDPEKNLFKKK